MPRQYPIDFWDEMGLRMLAGELVSDFLESGVPIQCVRFKIGDRFLNVAHVGPANPGS